MFQSTAVVHHNLLIKVFLATFRKPYCLNQLFLLDPDTEGMKIQYVLHKLLWKHEPNLLLLE